ncbi:protein transport protein sec20 [Podospora conica]|nr:protein transport protein sec20 [Schizothecium conicum]
MSSFESLQERLAALQETTAQLKTLIDRLADLKFEPGSVPLPSPSADDDQQPPSNVATELGAEINQILRDEDDELELLREEITDLRAGRPGSEAEHMKQRLREGVKMLEAELKVLRTTFRRAQLSARQSLLAAQKLERAILLASYKQPPPPTTPTSTSTPTQKHTELFSPRDRRRLAQHKTKNGGDSDILSASSDVTLSLRRTHALIAGEVSKSAFAAQTLAESTAALRELQQTYEGLDGLLARSRELVGALVTSTKSDTWYLKSAMYVLLATLAWLVFRRWLYGPLWWVVWLPVRTGWRVGGMALGRGRGVVDVVPAMVVPGAAVPTVEVGVGEKVKVKVKEEGEEESMVERVGRMIEDTLGEDGERRNRSEEGEGPNPMKRMWEEDVGDPEDMGDPEVTSVGFAFMEGLWVLNEK